MSLQKRCEEERRALDAAREQRLQDARTLDDLTRAREEFNIFLGWGRGNSKPEGALYGDS